MKIRALAAVAALGFAGAANADVTIHLGDFDLAPGTFLGHQYELEGTLTSWTVSFDYLGNSDASWASDAIFAIMSANGNAVEVGGYNLTFSFPSMGPIDGNSSDAGSYTHTITQDLNGLPLSSYDISGSGTWTFLVGDGWNGGSELSSYHNVVFTLVGVNLVPAPGALALLGLAGLIGTRRRR